MTFTVLSTLFRPMIEGRLPDWVEPHWFSTDEQLFELAPRAEIGWFDTSQFDTIFEAARRGVNLRWLNTVAAGVDPFPLDVLRERGVAMTNGTGLNSVPIAEYAVMGMLVIAKGYREVVRSQERREWLHEPPGKKALHGSKVLIVGAGGVGGRIGELLRPWGVDVTEVRRNPAPGVLTPDEWRGRLGEFDWVLVAVPSTAETDKMFGAAEFAAMKPGAAILNFARGAVLDQEALMAVLDTGKLSGAFLDVTDPEPLPPEHPLWGYDTVHISSHLSGRSQDTLFALAAERFIENLDRWNRGEPLVAQVDLELGY